MKVLFVLHDGVSHEPLGIEYLSSSLKAKGHRTRACMQSQVIDSISIWRPQFVAFQVLTGDEGRWGGVASAIKEVFPSVKIILGGPHFLFFSKVSQAEAEFVIRGDGEQSIVDVVEGRKHIDLLPIENLDSLPFPDRSILYNNTFPGIKNNVIRNVLATRGCIYKCSYCYNSSKEWQAMVGEGRKRLRSHSPEYMIEHIEKTFKDYGGELLSFQDDIFGIDLKWLERFSRLYRRLNIPFFAQLRPYLITEDRIKLLKEAGIHIVSFAIESGNPKTRKEILDRDEPNELIEKGCELLHRYGIKFRMQNLIGLPVDDPLEDALETLKFNIKCKPTLSWISMLQAYPGTTIADYVIKKGLVKNMEELQFKVNATFFEECSLPIKDKKKIERLQRYWSGVVRWPWLYDLVTKILINIDFGNKFHLWIFEKIKKHINQKEYWRIEKMERHISVKNQQQLDRLGNEPGRVKKVIIEEKVCA